VNLAGISGIKVGMSEKRFNENTTNRKKKKNRGLHREINQFNKGYQPTSNIVKMRMVIFLQVLLLPY
jgi:hypothetical protein